MLISARDFIFQDIYEYAALVESCAHDISSFIEINLEEDETIANRLLKPEKLSLLHHYIFTMIRIQQSRDYRKNSDLYNEEDALQLTRVFDNYGIQLIPFSKVENDFDEDDCDLFYEWFLKNENAFLEYWGLVTDEVFHIAFSNRRFLLQFGKSLAAYISENCDRLPKNIFSPVDRIARATRLPSWLKKAVFYRDHGRCVFCRKDLSGLLATDRRSHYDHIVPLALWGTNDPSNFQLLCEICNLRKGGTDAHVGSTYVPWWDY